MTVKFHENRSKGSGDMKRARTCYGRIQGLHDGLRDKGHSYNLPSASRREIKRNSGLNANATVNSEMLAIISFS